MMSSINHKGPKTKPAGFAPLNSRKTDQSVGQTYGERRDKVKTQEAEKGLNWVQRAKDRFLGNKKLNDTEEFANKEDRFLGSQTSHFSSNPIVEKKTQIETGLSHQSRVSRPAGDKYVHFLDDVILYIDAKTRK